MKKLQLTTVIALSLFLCSISIKAQTKDGQEIISFSHCLNYRDSCTHIGNIFINNFKKENFEDLKYLFSDTIHFRALTPPSLITLNNPTEVVNTLKKWFGVEEPDQFEVLESSSDFFVDCLYIYYRVFRTYKGNSYKVEQQLYCEVSSGKIQKISLLCSGFRKVEKEAETSVKYDVKNIESARELNQVELHKQYIGKWKNEMSKDTAIFWDGKPYGTGLECYFKLVANEEITIEGKQIWGYNKKVDKFILSELNIGVDNSIYASWFVSKEKCIMLPYDDITNLENASLKWEDEFKSPDMFLHKTIMNNKMVKTDTYIRVK